MPDIKANSPDIKVDEGLQVDVRIAVQGYMWSLVDEYFIGSMLAGNNFNPSTSDPSKSNS